MSELVASNQPEEITVAYWAIRGLAAPLRMMVMFAGKTLNSVNYECVPNADKTDFDRSTWFTAKPALKDENALINLPYVRIGESGRVVTQSTACMLHIGRFCRLLGDSEDDLCDIEQLLCEAMDLRNHVVRFAYSGDVQQLPQWLHLALSVGQDSEKNTQVAKLNLWLLRKYTGDQLADPNHLVVFVGDRVSAADFHIWELLDQLAHMALYSQQYVRRSQQSSADDDYDALTLAAVATELFGEAKALSAFYAKFRTLPQNQRYLSSPLYKILPANNLSANGFGATTTGEPWDMSKECNAETAPWLGLSGKY